MNFSPTKSRQNGALMRVLQEMRSASRDMQCLSLCVFLVGMHSLALGAFIFFFTELFYRIFFGVSIENFFFVKQSGLFLFCLGIFYLAPLAHLERARNQVIAMIATKILAVMFLVFNAWLVARPEMVLLAAGVDGTMAVLLIILSRTAGLFSTKVWRRTGRPLS
jgi:O-antigen/teichoic acid export membrane protein